MQGHEVYICYDKEDQITADAVCHYLEDNNIKCWIKNRDSGIKHEVEEIMNAISQSKVMVLVFSEYSKHSNHVKTEVDLAFTEQIPILVFKIEKSKLDGGLEFYISNAHWLDAYPEIDEKFETLIRDASRLLEKPVPDLIVSDGAKKLGRESDSYISERPAYEEYEPSFFTKYKKPIIAVLIILIVALGIFAFMNYDDGIGGSSEAQKDLPKIEMKITDFHVDDVRKEDTAWNYSYLVSGTLFPQPETGKEYKIVVDYYDKSGNIVDSTETLFDDAQKISSGYLFGSTVSDTNDIKRVEAQLLNDKNIVIAQSQDRI